VAGIVHRECRPVQIRRAKKPYEPVSQVLALHQNENRDYQHDDGGLEGSQDRLDNGSGNREHRRLWRGELDDERLLLRARRRSRRIGLAPARPYSWSSDRRGLRSASAEELRQRRNAGGRKDLDSLHLALDRFHILRDIGAKVAA
jgi:hypothetical protein